MDEQPTKNNAAKLWCAGPPTKGVRGGSSCGMISRPSDSNSLSFLKRFLYVCRHGGPMIIHFQGAACVVWLKWENH